MLVALKEKMTTVIDKKIEDTYAKKRLVSMYKTLVKLTPENVNPFEYV